MSDIRQSAQNVRRYLQAQERLGDNVDKTEIHTLNVMIDGEPVTETLTRADLMSLLSVVDFARSQVIYDAVQAGQKVEWWDDDANGWARGGRVLTYRPSDFLPNTRYRIDGTEV